MLPSSSFITTPSHLVIRYSSAYYNILASFPGLPWIFVLQSAFSTIHGSRRAAKKKNEEGLGTPIT